MNSQEPLDIPTFQLGNLAQEYAIDLWQRSLLYADVMRERGNQYQEHLAEAAPHVLSSKAEPVMFGSRLERPINYVLARIIPPEGADIDPRKRPFVVVDPRAASEPPAVGVVEAVRRPVTDTYEFMGRVQATDRVDLLARVNGFLEQQLFIEGAEVKDGDLLYRLEQPPYQADLEAKQAAVAQAEAQLANADIQLRRAKDLLRSPAGTQRAV